MVIFDLLLKATGQEWRETLKKGSTVTNQLSKKQSIIYIASPYQIRRIHFDLKINFESIWFFEKIYACLVFYHQVSNQYVHTVACMLQNDFYAFESYIFFLKILKTEFISEPELS